MSVFSKMKIGDVLSNVNEYGCDDAGFGEEFPGIFEVIARQRWEGNVRKMGKLLLFVDAGQATLRLTGAEEGVVAFYKKDSFGEALNALEADLQAGDVSWRKDKWA
jgi:hypothetical protein